MKKVIFAAAAFMAFGFANAQTQFGVKAGVQNTNFTGDADTDAKTGFYVGGFADITVTEKFHVQPELLYSDEGADDDLGLGYIRIPIMAKFYVVDNFSLMAGPEIAFKVSAKDDGFDDATKSVDFGLGFGAGYDFTKNIFVDLRYNLGLQNLNDTDADVDFKNSGFMLGVGYKF